MNVDTSCLIHLPTVFCIRFHIINLQSVDLFLQKERILDSVRVPLAPWILDDLETSYTL